MKVAFWSGTRNKTNVSANLAAVSIALAFQYPYKIIALENHLSNYNLGDIYKTPNNPIIKECGNNYYMGCCLEGLPGRLSYVENDLLNSLYIRELINDRLYYLPQGNSIHNQLFEYEFNNNIERILQVVNKCTDLCFIDTASQNSLSTKYILEQSDLIVVNFDQNLNEIKKIFHQCSSLVPKSVFILNGYKEFFEITDTIISKMFNISLENIIMLPHNEAFSYSIYRGNLIEYIIRNLYCDKSSKNFNFISSLNKLVKKIHTKAEDRIFQHECL